MPIAKAPVGLVFCLLASRSYSGWMLPLQLRRRPQLGVIGLH
jgi:hypothetical protein